MVQSNYLESDGTQHRWVHDNIKEVALVMEEAQKPSFFLEVGSTLLHNLAHNTVRLVDLLQIEDHAVEGERMEKLEEANRKLQK